MIKTDRLNQVGVLFKAFDCKLNYSSDYARLDINEVPLGKIQIVDKALADLDKMERIENYVSGITPLLIADTIDDNPNPLSEPLRNKVLEKIGLKSRGLWIRSKLVLVKNNNLWHLSETPNSCSLFKEDCTQRKFDGGRASKRKPDEYHKMTSKGISREQLTTTPIEIVFRQIPSSNLTNNEIPVELVMRKFSGLSLDEKIKTIQSIGKGK